MSYGVEALLKQRDEIDSELRKHKSPVTVMFTDLAGSTAYFDRHGDTAGVQWLEKHNSLVFPVIQQHQGTIVKTIGDSVMAYFTEAVQAAGAARDIEQRLIETNLTEPEDHQMWVRVALHQGLGYLRGGDVFGDVVNCAARLAKLCLPAQVIVSESVYRTIRETGEFEVSALGTQQLRGKTGQENLYELAFTDPQTYAALRERFPAKTSAAHEDWREGRYQVLGEIGRGAMGVVYRAFDRVIGRVVAMKTIPLEVSPEEREELITRLKQEARAAGILDHPNVVTIFDVGEESGLFYFTMQFVEGRTLTDYLVKKELIPIDTILTIMDQVCSAVGMAHQAGIIHRDLKPSNLMMTKQGVAKVLDFGIAKFGETALTKAGTVVGTPSYLSPEQAGGRRLDARSDIFSLGAVLYELVTSERAFAGESTTSIVYKILNEDPVPPIAIEPSVPQGLDAVIRKALCKDPNQRFQSCDEMRDALKICRSVVLPVGPPRPAAESTGAMRAAATSANKFIAIGAVGVVVLGLGVWALRPKPQPITAAPAATTSAPAVPAPAPVSSQPAAATPAAAAPATAATAETAAADKKHKKPAAEFASRGEKSSDTKPSEERDTQASSSGGMFGREEIPGLLSKADGYAGRGDYDKAIRLYSEILRVDPRNSSAQDGLRRAREARGMRR
jgi:class 3 adenylate cyclase